MPEGMCADPRGLWIGRADELNRFTGLLGEVRAGAGATMFVQGEAGIGKSRLLGAVLERAVAAGFRVFLGEADEFEKAQPFSPLAQALPLDSPPLAAARALLTAGASAATAAAAAEDSGFRVIQELCGYLETATAHSPVVLAVEDLHWADPATLRALRRIPRVLAHRPFALIGTLREVPRAPELDRLLDRMSREGARSLRLAPLHPDDAARLAARLLGRRPGPRLAELVRSAGGNPLLIVELVQSLAEDRALIVHEDVAEAAVDPVPARLRLAARRRLADLQPETAQLLEIAAVTGASFSLTDLSAVTDRPIRDLLPAVRESVRAGLLSDGGDRLVFRQPLIRDALYEDMPPPVLRELHREIGHALARAGAPASRVAEQLCLGATEGDHEAAGWLRQAAAEATSRSTATAAQLLERAAELVGEDHPDYPGVVADLVPLLGADQRTAGPEERDTPFFGGPSPQTEVRVRLSLILGLAWQSRWREVGEQLERVTDLATGALRQRALVDMSMVMYATGDLSGAQQLAGAVLAESDTAGSSIGAAMAQAVRAGTLAARGDLMPWTDRLQEPRGTAESAVPEPSQSVQEGLLVTDLLLGVLQSSADRLGAAAATLQRAHSDATRWGIGSWLPAFHSGLAVTRFAAGRWDEAVSEADSCRALSEELRRPAVPHAYGVLARIALAHGDLDGVQATLSAAELDELQRRPGFGTAWVTWASALLLEARGHLRAAAERAATAVNTLPQLRHVEGTWLIQADAVRLLLAVGERSRAQALTRDIALIAERSAVASLRGTALRCQGLVDHDCSALMRAVEAFRESPRVFEQALAAEDTAANLARRGRTQSARAYLDEALAIYDDLGAVREQRRAAAVFHHEGERPQGERQQGEHRPRPPRPTVGWTALTSTEVAVASLVAEGLTNAQTAERLFISPYTVATHLKHIFAKLGITSRVELATETTRRLG